MNHFKSIFLKPFVQNLLFWTISFIVLLRVFTRTDEVRLIDIIYTSLFHLPLLIGVVINQICIRYFLKNKNYTAYWTGFILSVLFIIQIYPLTFEVLADWIFPNFYFVAVYEWYEMLGIGFVYVGLSLLLHFANEWVIQQKALTRLSQLEEEQRKAELQILRGQINPHFLFNSLNTIYGEALKKSDKTPALVLKLSDMLRYAVDSIDRPTTKLSAEINYLKDFVGLQKERLDHPEYVHFSVTGDPGEHRIAPLLLINFVENCFKHGAFSDLHPLRITIDISGSWLHLRTRNHIRSGGTSLEVSSGTGIRNAQKRLELIYPERHSLSVQHDDDAGTFTLDLQIKLDS